MKKAKAYVWLLPIWLLLSTACSDDDYQYPPVKLEFLTAFSGDDGNLKTVLTDEGESLQVLENASNVKIGANGSVRIVSNYAPVVGVDGSKGIKLYPSLTTVSPIPLPANKFENGVKTDPADIQSIWMGLDYLNVLLTIKGQDGKHLFHFVEEEKTVDTATGHATVRLTLFHDASGDVQAYPKRAYLSVPLVQYAVNGVRQVKVYFTLKTYSGEQKTYEFDYIPHLNQ